MTDGSICFDSSISIHALLAESDPGQKARPNCQSKISIHALLAESDFCLGAKADSVSISIHALLAESDAYCSV